MKTVLKILVKNLVRDCGLLLCLGCVTFAALGSARASARHSSLVIEALNDSKELVDTLSVSLSRHDALLADLFGRESGFSLDHTVSIPVSITAYSLSEDETDNDPLQAAYGRSRIFMAAPSDPLINDFGLQKGDRFAILSDDGEVRAICIFWDRMNSRWDDYRVDIVAPASEIAVWHGIKPGRLVLLVGK